MIFVDTSAFLAILSSGDLNHQHALRYWRSLLEEDRALLTNNYVLVESIVLLQKRFGISKVHDFQDKMLPFLTIDWIDEKQHYAGLQDILSANRRQLSLVDCSCFESMRRLGIDKVFSFDEHFHEQGLEVIP